MIFILERIVENDWRPISSAPADRFVEVKFADGDTAVLIRRGEDWIKPRKDKGQDFLTEDPTHWREFMNRGAWWEAANRWPTP